VSGFSAEWLALREPYDRRARNAKVLADVAATFSSLPAMTVVDLACGTGATRRAIASHLPLPQRWRLVDNDLSLLARADIAPMMGSCTATTMPLDLVRDLEAALDGAVDLVTTTALLDLVSMEWLDRLAVEIAARRLPLYAALSYDGRVTLAPAETLDEAVVAAVNRHQTTDKGFGPALGPRAAQTLIARFRALGYAVSDGPSDWNFGPDDREIQRQLLAGWLGAARAIGGIGDRALADWLEKRNANIAAGRSVIRVGHTDIFARPMATR
jgi:hypothetical protein